MYRSDFAETLGFEDLVKLEGTEKDSPTMDGMIFLDCAPNPKKDNKRKLFPCYVTGVQVNDEGEPVALGLSIVQWVHGTPQIVMVKMKRETIEKGDKFLFWDIPPTALELAANPFPETAETAEGAKDIAKTDEEEKKE